MIIAKVVIDLCFNDLYYLIFNFNILNLLFAAGSRLNINYAVKSITFRYIGIYILFLNQNTVELQPTESIGTGPHSDNQISAFLSKITYNNNSCRICRTYIIILYYTVLCYLTLF